MSATWAALLAVGLAAGRSHPMHTAVAEVVQQDDGGATSVQIRVFADDLQAAVPLPQDRAGADSALARYLRGTFALTDRRGRPIALRWDGVQRTGDVVLLRLRGDVPGGLAGARVTSLLLCERFSDQVNIVRASYGGRTTTVLFLRGEASKGLP